MMKRKNVRRLFAILTPALAAIAAPAVADECMNATSAQIDEARAAMEVLLKDATSARFLDVCVLSGSSGSNGNPVLCGSVNAKNSMGAYTGYQKFGYVLGAKTAVLLDLDDSSAGITSRFFYCKICLPDADCSQLLN
jgi:hypothetical protein